MIGDLDNTDVEKFIITFLEPLQDILNKIKNMTGNRFISTIKDNVSIKTKVNFNDLLEEYKITNLIEKL